MPHACIVAYAVTGPVKVNPRRRSSRDRFLEAGVQEGMSAVLAGPVLAGAVLLLLIINIRNTWDLMLSMVRHSGSR